jgi:glucose dehydrogenase
MPNRAPKLAGALIAAAVIFPTAIRADWEQAAPVVGRAIDLVRSLLAPADTTATEQAPSIDNAGASVSLTLPVAAEPSATANDWPSYNKTLTLERYSPLNQINTTNIGQLKVLCTNDTHQYTSFETGPIMVQNALIGTTEHDIFSIDPATCHENWRTHEDYKPGSLLALNRGDATTGAYQRHFKLVPKDWHDWDVSSTPSVIQPRGGRKLLSVAPKDNNLYGFDLYTHTLLYRVPVTWMEDDEASFAVGKHIHFYPGTTGGAEWNGPAYGPRTNLVLIGEVECCSTVTLQSDAQIRKVPLGKPSSGAAR